MDNNNTSTDLAEGKKIPSPGAHTKTKLINISTQLFGLRGQAGVSLTTISEQLQIRKSSIFYYVGSKADLVELVLVILLNS